MEMENGFDNNTEAFQSIFAEWSRAEKLLNGNLIKII